MIVQYNELYELSFYAQKNTPLFYELKYILWSIYEGLEQMGDIEETEKDYFVINNEKDMMECFDFLEEKHKFVLESADKLIISIQ